MNINHSNPDGESLGTLVEEPSLQEVIYKRRFPLAEAMKTSITLEEMDRRLTEKIYRHFHPES